MLRIIRQFKVRSDDGQELILEECSVESDTTTMRNESVRSTHRDHYFREAHGGMRAKRAVEIRSGVFKIDNEPIEYRAVDE
jgi:hypothetical protein